MANDNERLARVRGMHALAHRLIVEAQREKMLPADMGITVIVHDATLHPGNMQTAMDTTLPNRPVLRALIGDTLANLCIADGATSAEEASDMVDADLAAVRFGPAQGDA